MADTPNEQPLAQWVNETFAFTENLLPVVAGPHYRYSTQQEILDGLGISYDDVLTMAHIGTRLQLIASNIDSRAAKLRIVQNG